MNPFQCFLFAFIGEIFRQISASTRAHTQKGQIAICVFFFLLWLFFCIFCFVYCFCLKSVFFFSSFPFCCFFYLSCEERCTWICDCTEVHRRIQIIFASSFSQFFFSYFYYLWKIYTFSMRVSCNTKYLRLGMVWYEAMKLWNMDCVHKVDHTRFNFYSVCID